MISYCPTCDQDMTVLEERPDDDWNPDGVIYHTETVLVCGHVLIDGEPVE